MKSRILNVVGSQVISKKAQQEIKGGAGSGKPNIAMCGCDCAGNVTGPSYCSFIMGCPQVYTC